MFDGRLLHGAPACRSLLRPGDVDKQNREINGGDDEARSSLRVTFLVNIWKSGRPAGVDILPWTIRDEIRSVASETMTSFRGAMPLEFQWRHASKLSVNSSGDDRTKPVDGKNIVLPFVSAGATGIGGEEADMNEEDCREAEEREHREKDEEEEDDGDLFLVLPPFATPEYLEEKSDTIVLSFDDRNRAQLVREGALSPTMEQDWPWKKSMALSKTEKQTTDATFLSYLKRQVPTFVSSIAEKLKSQFAIDVSHLQADHVCYRTDSHEQYTSLVEALQSWEAEDFTLLVESEIGGRPIATFKLAEPIKIESADGDYIVDVVEIPSPKEGSPYKAGLEHVEFVIGGLAHESPVNNGAHRTVLESWMERHPAVSWNTKAINKKCNPDVSMKMELGEHGKVSIKFHLMPLEKVIEFEIVVQRRQEVDEVDGCHGQSRKS